MTPVVTFSSDASGSGDKAFSFRIGTSLLWSVACLETAQSGAGVEKEVEARLQRFKRKRDRFRQKSRRKLDELRAMQKKASQNENPEHLRPDSRVQPVIFVVDDDVMVENIVRITLERNGYFILTAENGEEAVMLSNGRLK